MAPRAVVLLSGGIDSSTALAVARSTGYEAYALTFAYRQRHIIEIEASKRVARALGAVEHKIVEIDLGWMSTSALTNTALNVPKEGLQPGIPITYVPARNALFLCYALGWAEVLGADDIFIGVSAVDYSGYPDCRPEFIAAFEDLARVATKAGVEGCKWQVRAPLISMNKGEIIRTGQRLGVDYALTHSCYDPTGERACGRCESCLLRKRGFETAQIADPTQYA